MTNVVQFPRMLHPIARDQVELARRATAAPLKPKTAQKPCDLGLFSDEPKQFDLVDLARRPT